MLSGELSCPCDRSCLSVDPVLEELHFEGRKQGVTAVIWQKSPEVYPFTINRELNYLKMNYRFGKIALFHYRISSDIRRIFFPSKTIPKI